MTTARDIMTPRAEWVREDQTVAEVAKQMAKSEVGAFPVCDGEGRLQGMLTDRDIALKVVAEGRDPGSTTVADVFERQEVVTIGADDPVEDAITTMKQHAVRRLPVIDGRDYVGMVSQADIARALPDVKVGDLVGAISEAPANN